MASSLHSSFSCSTEASFRIRKFQLKSWILSSNSKWCLVFNECQSVLKWTARDRSKVQGAPTPSQKVQVPSTLPSRKCIADNSSHCNSHAMKVWALAISGIWNDPSILVKLFFIQFLWRPIQIDQQSISWQYLTWINLFKLTTSLFQIPQHPSVLPLVQLDQTRTQTQS